MAIKVTGEMIIPASDRGFCVDIQERYTHAHGLRRVRYIMKTSEPDFYNGRVVCYSEDNGRTWGAEENMYAGDFIASPDGSWEILNFDIYADVYNPIHRHFVDFRIERIFKGGRKAAYVEFFEKGRQGFSDHCYLLVRREDGGGITSDFVQYEQGSEFNPENPLDTSYFSKNTGWCSIPHITKNGDVLFILSAPVSACCRILGSDVQEIFPSNPDIMCGMIICRGKWNGKNYDLTFSRPVIISDLQSSRGMDEPTIAELGSGRILVVFRGSNVKSEDWNTRIEPGAPGFKWYCYSDDGGKTFIQPMPWRFDDGEVIYSSATVSHFIRIAGNKKLYWVGNITDHRVNGNYPRWPLQIVEVDEKYGTAKKESLTVIDTRRDWESEMVQLSNFSMLEDRETGNIELRLVKLGQFEGDDSIYRAETWKYRICFNDRQ